MNETGKASTQQICWFGRIREFFSTEGMRATGPRRTIAVSVFAGGRDRHFTAQEIHRDLVRTGSRLSLATVYNTLNSLSDAGLLRKVPIGDGNYFFDTNRSEHVHILTESEDGTHVISDADNLERAIAELRQLAGKRTDPTVFRIVV